MMTSERANQEGNWTLVIPSCEVHCDGRFLPSSSDMLTTSLYLLFAISAW